MEDILNVELNNLRGISSLSIKMPLTPDVYALTGLNGAGKSTLLMGIAPRLKSSISFSALNPNDYNDNTKIRYQIGENYEEWSPINNWKWEKKLSGGKLFLRGFQEGSIMRGTRFWNASYLSYKKLEHIREEDLINDNRFIQSDLSWILHNDTTHYKGLCRIDKNRAKYRYGYDGVPYFIRTEHNNIISQFDLSTGEFLLINLLHLIYNLIIRGNNSEKLKLILIDEIELALHPSAIKRLVEFMKDIAKKYRIAVYFATHSLEIIHTLNVNNLFYLEQDNTGVVECKNPCYPAYITRDIYMHDGYDVVILVEDDLAQNIVKRFIKNIKAEQDKAIQILPVGGYENTLELHNNLLAERVLNTSTNLISIIDGDVEKEVLVKIGTKRKAGIWDEISNDKVLFLPIESLEKYLKRKLYDEQDNKFMRLIRDKIYKFQTDINWFREEYQLNIDNEKLKDKNLNKTLKDDRRYFSNGKCLFNILAGKAKQGKYEETAFRKEICDIVLGNEDFTNFEQVLKNEFDLIFGKNKGKLPILEMVKAK